MSEVSKPMPRPELLKQYRELLTTEKYSYSSIKDLVQYLRTQPPKSQDAVTVGDLLIQIREDVRNKIDPSALDVSNYSFEDYGCRCSGHMFGITAWYKLAIMLDPNNPLPYQRLAREVWWEKGEWPGCTLEPLAKENCDKITTKRVMRQYQKEDSDLIKQIELSIGSL